MSIQTGIKEAVLIRGIGKDGPCIDASTGQADEIITQIKSVLDEYIKPAVEMDGGNIEFRKWDAGRVFVTMQGACSGCPSSTVTLKAGIEGMLKRMVPEVTEVVAEMG